MSYSTLTVDINDNIAHIQLNRPNELNSMNIEFWQEFPNALKEIDQQAAARVIVLSATGKHFCAGMDINIFTNGTFNSNVELGRKHENMARIVRQLQDTFSLLEQVRMPILVAVQGGCIGGALDMISACDIRYATDNAFFSIEETKLGITADLGTLQRLPYLIPSGLVREMAYTGRRLSAEEALNAGLVNALFPNHSALLAGVMDIARQIALNSPLAVTGCKTMLNYSRDHSLNDSLSHMAMWQSGMFQPQNDMQECFNAKADKRSPQFEQLCKITSTIAKLSNPSK